MSGSNILVDTNLIILGIGGNRLVRELLVIAASSITKKLPLFTADKGFGKISDLNVILL